MVRQALSVASRCMRRFSSGLILAAMMGSGWPSRRCHACRAADPGDKIVPLRLASPARSFVKRVRKVPSTPCLRAIITKSWVSRRTPRPRRSRRLIAASRASTTLTSTRAIKRRRRSSRKFSKRTTCSPTRRSGRSTTATAPPRSRGWRPAGSRQRYSIRAGPPKPSHASPRPSTSRRAPGSARCASPRRSQNH